jgi:hypothetical protein
MDILERIPMDPLRISDFESAGVKLTAATDADFDARAQTILDGKATPLLELKPYLAIVQNENARTVVAYAVAWTTVQRNGSSETSYGQFKFPDAVAGTNNGLSLLAGREIRTGEERLVGMGFEAWPADHVHAYRDFGLAEAHRLTNVKSVQVALDAVILDDGAMLGPDQSRLAEHFIEYVHAKQSLYRDIVVGLENGRADVFAPLRSMVSAPVGAPPHGRRLDNYSRLAAEEILRFQDRVALEVFRRTLRREPFSIRRPSGK